MLLHQRFMGSRLSHVPLSLSGWLSLTCGLINWVLLLAQVGGNAFLFVKCIPGSISSCSEMCISLARGGQRDIILITCISLCCQLYFSLMSTVFLGFVKGISGWLSSSSGSSLIFGTGWGRGSNPASLGRAHKETAKNETKQKLTADTHLSFHKRSNQAQKEMWGN